MSVPAIPGKGIPMAQLTPRTMMSVLITREKCTNRGTLKFCVRCFISGKTNRPSKKAQIDEMLTLVRYRSLTRGASEKAAVRRRDRQGDDDDRTKQTRKGES